MNERQLMARSMQVGVAELSKLASRYERERDELADAGHALGLLALQSERYGSDPDYRDATDAMLAALRKVGRLP